MLNFGKDTKKKKKNLLFASFSLLSRSLAVGF